MIWLLTRRNAFAATTLAVILALASHAVAQQRTSLDGNWNFVIDPDGKLMVADLAAVADARSARVPGSWQSEFAELRDYAGVAWYWRTFTAPPLAAGHVLLVHFGAVDYRADVYVNGQKAGEHEGGYLPFEIDTTPFLRTGENQLAVRVVDPGAKPSEVEGIRYAEIPHGKQDWYVQTSGLWQSVEIEDRPKARIGALHVRAGADGRFTVDLEIINPPGASAVRSNPAGESSSPANATYAGAEIRDASGTTVWKQSLNLSSAQARCSFSGTLANPQLWSPATPYLYTVKAWLSSGDAFSGQFGVRTFTTSGGRFYLNGKPIYLRGALDQDFYPDTVYTPPSLDFVRHEMTEAKAMGLNLLRCHIKVPDPRYLEAADSVGMLIWYEIPNWDKLTPDSERRGLETLEGMVDRDWNHPSIIAVSLINESWGVDLKQAPQRDWLKRFSAQAHQLVPGWLVDDNSACCENFHMASDIADFHDYASIPDAAGDFDHFVTDLANRPAWLWSPYNDAQVNSSAPLMLSEFGNWGLPHVPDPRPWWFNRDFGGREITRPAGLADRYADYGYSALFSSLAALSDATEERQYQSLKYEIESLRSHPEIQGYVITEFTDVNWESNGLLDMGRHPKAAGGKLGPLQADDLIVARIPKRNFVSGEHVHADLFVSHYSDFPLAGATILWSLAGFDQTYVKPLPAIEAGSAAPAGSIDFTAPAVSSPEPGTLSFRVEAGGKTISENSIGLYFYPPRKDDLRPAVSFIDPARRLRRLSDEMRARGYLAPSGSEALPVAVASALNDQAQAILQNGGRVILIASSKQSLAPGVEITPRAHSDLDGDWISNFLWVRKDHPIFHGIGFNTFPEFEAQAANPPAVIQGLPPGAFPDVLAGIFYGWLHLNSGVLLQARAGKGKLLVTTFGFDETYGSDPYATALLDSLVRYAVSDFEPKFELRIIP